jgi:hypothetical protein
MYYLKSTAVHPAAHFSRIIALSIESGHGVPRLANNPEEDEELFCVVQFDDDALANYHQSHPQWRSILGIEMSLRKLERRKAS